MDIIKKLIGWVSVNLGGLIGILQGIVKVLKETCTAIMNILFPLIPNDNFKVIVTKIREVVNKVDEWLEKIKVWLLAVGIK